MKHLLTILTLLVTLSSLGQTDEGHRFTKPYDTIDFSAGQWVLIFKERTTDTTFSHFGETEEVINLIDDRRILDSLKSTFKCDESKQLDGPHEFTIELVKDHRIISTYVYNDTNNFSLGKLRNYMRPCHIQRKTLVGTKQFSHITGKLMNRSINYYYNAEWEHFHFYCNSAPPNKPKADYRFDLEMSFKNIDNSNVHCKQAIMELTSLFPNIDINRLSFDCNGNTWHNGRRYYTIGIPCDANFKLDENSLLSSSNLLDYKIIGITPMTYYLSILK